MYSDNPIFTQSIILTIKAFSIKTGLLINFIYF